MEPTASTNTTSARVAVKLSLGDETHRVTLEQSDLSFEALNALVPQTFAQATPKTWALVYTDNEGDLVTVSSASEFSEARRVFLELSGGERKTMHFRVLPRVSVKDQIPPAVLHAVDELSSTIARLASGTRESLSQNTYLERGCASVVFSAKQTREFLESARREIAQRLKDVQARIVGEIERRRSSASSADEAVASVMVGNATVPSPSLEEEEKSHVSDDEDIEMETRYSQAHLIEDDSDDEEEADDEKDSDDEDDEAEDKREGEPALLPLSAAVEAVATEAIEAPREEEAAAVETPYESDAETVASSSSDEDDEDDGSDRDWDVVPDVWNAEVALIRNILPHVHVEDCVAMLQKHNGNLEAAINELTDV